MNKSAEIVFPHITANFIPNFSKSKGNDPPVADLNLFHKNETTHELEQ